MDYRKLFNGIIIFFVVSSSPVISAFQIIFNKAVLSAFDFPFPMFLTTWHMIVSMVLTQFLSRTTDLLPGVREVVEFDFFLSLF
jgi:hypothetical protein